eukprot:CAMPEP_0185019240 /NCGR_PEP_ID=MMETSP1103-20130426/1865_1 /TAXON_ID=36769 /ORGANISM="Paraphysomonas bandaiensis, Strain Caron Lab Isolate" /LENGTH=1852 /DNA_ID=CAMNT_0027549443 /DNA_START=18 /DNA_END=5573 /DNA_ORIENTATION=+
MSQRLLIVDVVAARNLIACERSGTSDPYVSANLLDIANRDIKHEKFKTSSKSKTLNPKWGERLTFGQNYDLNNTAALPTLSLKVFHKSSSLVGADAPMGQVEIPLSSIPPDGAATTQWHELQVMGRMRDVAGEIQVTIKFSGPPPGAPGATQVAGSASAENPLDETNPDYEDAEPNELVIICIQGRELPIMDMAMFGKGSSDPLIKAKIKGFKTQQTKHIKKTLEPVWNETLVFQGVRDPSLSLEILVEDHDTLSNDFMGKVIIPLFQFEDKKPLKKWYKLLDSHGNADGVNRGEVELNIVWRFNPDVVEAAKPGGLLGALGKIGRDSDSEIDDDGDEPVEEPVVLDPEEAERQQKEKEEAEAALKKELGDIEVKSGDYQVQVHIIEARELKGKDLNGLSDPVVNIECFDQKQNGTVVKEALSCVFDELFIFNFRNMDKDVFSEGVIRVKVMNANVVTKNDLIGAYAFDATQVYFQKDHEHYRKWVALMNDDDPQDTGVQGYLKLSIQIVGPGDKLKVHDEEEEARKEREAMAKNGADIGAMVIMPPTIKKEWKYVVTSIYRAEYLPVMDQQPPGLGMVVQNGTDAFCQVEFAGGKPQKTKVRTVKGERNAMNPMFNYEIWYPVSTPTATQTIKFSVWDHDVTGSDLIATVYSKFNMIQKLGGDTGVHWENLYGAPVSAGYSLKNTLKGGITKLKNVGEQDYTEVYNTYPDRAPSFKGRILISQRIETQRPKKYDTDEIEPFRRSIKRIPQKAEPPTKLYVLKALVVSGTELPQFVDAKNPLKKKKLQIQVSIGRYEMFTQRAECNKGVSEWNELLQQEMEYPVDTSQIPDICVYICTGSGSDLQPVCFYRMKAKDLLKGHFREPPKWIFMKEDKSIDALDDGEFPGSVLIRLGFGPVEDAEATKLEWEQSVQRMRRRSPYQVRCHIYQGKDLPAADSNGLLDPFLKVNLLGQIQESDKKKKTRYPLYYQTLCFDCDLPEREFLPQVNIRLFDTDLLKNEYMGQCFFNLQDAFVLDNLEDELPDPKYHSLFVEEPGDGQGELLINFQLIPKTRPDMVFPKPESIQPSLRPAFIEVIALGIRNMKPYKFQSMVSPFLEMEMECIDKKVTIVTEDSKKPSPDDPNFLQRLVMPVMLPDNALFATPMALRARDMRLGGYMKPEVGVGEVDLIDKIPWSKTYKPPQTDIFFQDSMNMAAGFVTADGAEETKEPPLDEAARKAIELQEKRTAQVEDDDYVLTQEPLDLDKFIKQRINEDDFGAGVFGALTHLELPEYGGKRKKTADDFFTEIDWEEEVDEPPKYMVNRPVLKSELEEELKTTPFESYFLTRGQTNHPILGNTLKIVGKFKGLIRVMLNEDEPPLLNLEQLLKPQGYKIRLYVLRGTNLTPMDIGFGGRPGKSDPYLKVKLGKEKFDDRENAIDDVTDVDFYKLVEFNAELPGFSQLVISVMDKDDIGSDDVIGTTIIDLEDRWFDNRWQEFGRENRVVPTDDPNNIRWDTKHLERRTLYVPSSNNGQGIVECWVDIMTPAEAGAFPPDDVALPPRKMFELRVVIWKTKDVPAQDTLGGQNMTDLYIKAWPEGCKEQSTDTHWRSKKGKASFNWRMIFDVELGHNTRAMKFPHFHFQMWDRDIIKWNDCFAEGAIDMGFYYRKAFKKDIAIKLYETPKGAAAKRTKKQNKESKMVEVGDTTEDIPPPEEPAETPETEEEAGLLDSALEDKDSDDEDSDAGIGVLGGMKNEEKKRLAEETEKKVKQRDNEQPEEKPSVSFKERVFGIFKRKNEEDEEEEEEEAADEETPPPPKDPDQEEQDNLINSVKQMTGLWDIDPDDSTWMYMDHLDHETGIREPMGKICYSMQLW